ncbi:serine carboxypeptidase S28 [Ancylostoma duodenale]|uniref:Serine carboxypeptidase S28 n=1 Tax=Ancylostoma duodenale TaxID=51022 RepID=A0A0C2FP65_9BILA|nr:serine carboxypeptidase S28 [Ancylostoma duodenale]
MDFASLSLLTTEQALADLAYFITSMNQKYGFKNPRWVTFGGSYPEYAKVVEDDLTVTNKDCPGNVKDAFDKMQNLSKTVEGRNQLNKYFNLQPPFDKNTVQRDITNFFANVYSIFQGMSQYTYDGRNTESEKNLTDAKVCEIMMDNKVPDVITRVYNVYLWFNGITGDPKTDLTVFPNSYNDMIASVKTGNLTILGEDNGETYFLDIVHKFWH